jgi:hypothetical protein
MVVKVFVSGISGNKEVSAARALPEADRLSGWLCVRLAEGRTLGKQSKPDFVSPSSPKTHALCSI